MNKNITCVYYTANKIPDFFANTIRKQLLKAVNGIPIISVSQKPIDFGENICVGDVGVSHPNIYKQALAGAKKAKTKYISLAEDDALYSAEHFDYIPKKDTFGYDKNIWNIYTWVKPPVFSWKGRRNLNGLICERDLFIKVMEERFAKYPNEKDYPLLLAEPGKYERIIGVRVNKWEFYNAKEPSVVFSHPNELSYAGLGKRKRLGLNITTELSPWGSAETISKLYE